MIKKNGYIYRRLHSIWNKQDVFQKLLQWIMIEDVTSKSPLFVSFFEGPGVEIFLRTPSSKLFNQFWLTAPKQHKAFVNTSAQICLLDGIEVYSNADRDIQTRNTGVLVDADRMQKGWSESRLSSTRSLLSSYQFSNGCLYQNTKRSNIYLHAFVRGTQHSKHLFSHSYSDS